LDSEIKNDGVRGALQIQSAFKKSARKPNAGVNFSVYYSLGINNKFECLDEETVKTFKIFAQMVCNLFKHSQDEAEIAKGLDQCNNVYKLNDTRQPKTKVKRLNLVLKKSPRVIS
jgi:hypothetical protein